MTRENILSELKKRDINAKVVFKSVNREAWLYIDNSNLGRLLREETFVVPDYRNTFFNELQGDAELSSQY